MKRHDQGLHGRHQRSSASLYCNGLHQMKILIVSISIARAGDYFKRTHTTASSRKRNVYDAGRLSCTYVVEHAGQLARSDDALRKSISPEREEENSREGDDGPEREHVSAARKLGHDREEVESDIRSGLGGGAGRGVRCAMNGRENGLMDAGS